MESNWYAIKTRQDFKANEVLRQHCEEVFFPTEVIKTPTGATRTKALIPHVVFIRTTRDHALDLEQRARDNDNTLIPFWIYRYIKGQDIQPIPPMEINLLRLVSTQDPTRCQIYNKADFTPGQRVRVTGGVYEGYVGTVHRVKKNKHVIVQIEGLCLIMLPYIHPDLLQPIP